MKRKTFNPIPNFTEDRIFEKKASTDPFQPSSVEPPQQPPPQEPPPQKSPREKRTGHEPESRALAVQTQTDGNPVLALRQWFQGARDFHPDVKRFIERLFDQLAKDTEGGFRGLTREDAEHHNERIYIELMVASLQHELLTVKPQHKSYFTLCKALSLWMTRRAKLKESKPAKGNTPQGRRTVPTSPIEPHETEVDDGSGVDGMEA